MMPGRRFDAGRQVRRHELGDLDFAVEQSRDALLRLAHHAIDHDVRVVGTEPARIRILFQDDVVADHQFLEP